MSRARATRNGEPAWVKAPPRLRQSSVVIPTLGADAPPTLRERIATKLRRKR